MTPAISHTPQPPMLQSAMPKPLPNLPHNLYKNAKISNILDNHPAEVVEIALNALQRAGIQMIEWRALLYRRMRVPILVSVSSNINSQVIEKHSS